MRRHNEFPVQRGRASQFLGAVSSFGHRVSSELLALGVFLTLGVVSAAAQVSPAPAKVAAPPTVSLPGFFDPVADPKAIVTVGNARFTVLTPRLIRMEWAADGKFEDHASLVFLNRKLPVPKFDRTDTKSGTNDIVSIRTEALELTYFTSRSGDKFGADKLKITFKLNGKEVTWRSGAPDTGNLQGTTRTLDGALGGKTQEPMDPGLISRDGWVVVDDSTRPLFDGNDFRFDKGAQSAWPWVMQRPEGNRQDWYFFGYGHDYEAALHDFTLVAGKIPLPPRFAFGAWWSRYWAYSDQELMALAQSFRSNDVPLDIFVIDIDWHPTYTSQMWWISKEQDASGHDKGWSGYSWNRTLFPDPEQFLKDLHGMGLKTTLNLHPASGIQPWEDAYPTMARAMGVDPATRQYVAFDITNKQFAMNYLDLVHQPLEKQGIDFWWLDWQQESTTKTTGVNPTWWLNYVHFNDQAREGKRPLLFHRWGGLGNHRYQIGFSGDTISVWESLAFQPWFTATAANVGYAYWSHDIGGHMPGNVEPELYTRWIQFGIYSPILRTHTTKNPDAERRIWAYPEPYSDIMRNLYHERYALLPYVYTEARGTYDSGVAFLHPLYYDWPEANDAYDMKNEYAFGSQMIVNPIVIPADKETGLAKQAAWIPNGEWIEKDTGAHFFGPAKIQRNFSIEQTPVYVRAGAIVPMAPPMQYSNQKPVDPLIVEAYPPRDGGSSMYSLYEDAGDTRGYQTGQFAWTKISAASKSNVVTLTIAGVKGSFTGMLMHRAYEIRFPGDWPPAAVKVNGQALAYAPQAGKPGWRYEGNTLTTVITTRVFPVTQTVSVNVVRAPELVKRAAELNGFAGAMTRLNSAMQTLRTAVPFALVPEELLDAAQTGDKMSYYPDQAGAVMTHYREVLAKAQATVNANAKQGTTEQQKAAVGEQRGTEHDTPKSRAELADYPNKLAKAAALVNDAVGKSGN